MESINDEYKVKRIIYEKQKKYRKTQEGKGAIAKANRKYNIKQRITRIYELTNYPECNICGDGTLGFLTISESKLICFNCKFGLTEEEIKECQ